MKLYLFFTIDYDTGYYSHLQGVFESLDLVQQFIKKQKDEKEAFYDDADYRIVIMELNTPNYTNLGY